MSSFPHAIVGSFSQQNCCAYLTITFLFAGTTIHIMAFGIFLE